MEEIVWMEQVTNPKVKKVIRKTVEVPDEAIHIYIVLHGTILILKFLTEDESD